jgi:hypothetical protein
MVSETPPLSEIMLDLEVHGALSGCQELELRCGRVCVGVIV